MEKTPDILDLRQLRKERLEKDAERDKIAASYDAKSAEFGAKITTALNNVMEAEKLLLEE
jgi:hypothetical protein